MSNNFGEGQLRAPSLTERTALPTERPGDFYTYFLGLKTQDIRHKTLLNIGSGSSDLQRDLKEKDTHVINSDLRYKTLPKNGSNSVAADMTALPLTDNSVDTTVALYSAFHLPKMVHSQAIREMVRVAREKVIIYPCSTASTLNEYLSEHNLDKVINIESPRFNPLLLFANMEIKKGIFGNFARLALNAYYALDVEALAALFRQNKRLTINTAILKSIPNWEEIIPELTKNGLDLS